MFEIRKIMCTGFTYTAFKCEYYFNHKTQTPFFVTINLVQDLNNRIR